MPVPGISNTSRLFSSLKKGTAAWHAHRAKQWEVIALKNWQLAMSPVLPADAKMCDAHAAGTWHTAKPEHLKGTAGLTLDEAGAEADDDDDHDAENANRHTGSLDASRALKQKRRQVSAEMTRLKSAVTKGSAKDKASIIAKAGKLKLDEKDAESAKYYTKARHRPEA